jgi:hypothetical protein
MPLSYWIMLTTETDIRQAIEDRGPLTVFDAEEEREAIRYMRDENRWFRKKGTPTRLYVLKDEERGQEEADDEQD